MRHPFQFMNPSVGISLFLFVVVASLGSALDLAAQDKKKDPTVDSDVIKKTMSKIREVEKLDAYVAQNKQLVDANKALQKQIASINKQVAKLQKDLAGQQAKLRKQLLQMPSFKVKAKIIGNGKNMALLQMKSQERPLLITSEVPVSIQVSDGVYLLMQVKKISKNAIELHFPELERDLFLYN